MEFHCGGDLLSLLDRNGNRSGLHLHLLHLWHLQPLHSWHLLHLIHLMHLLHLHPRLEEAAVRFYTAEVAQGIHWSTSSHCILLLLHNLITYSPDLLLT